MTNITVSLETAKKLKEAGWSKECICFYCRPTNYKYLDTRDDKRVLTIELPKYMGRDEVEEAPTAQEILDVLPRSVDRNGYYYKIQIHCLIDGTYGVVVENRGIEMTFRGSNLSEALADLWIVCKESGYLSS